MVTKLLSLVIVEHDCRHHPRQQGRYVIFLREMVMLVGGVQAVVHEIVPII